MPNPHYRAGDHFEKRVADHLRADGYAVWQTRGSKSPADLIAIKPGETLFVQVKAGATTLDHAEWNALIHTAIIAGALPIIADRDGRGIRYRRILGGHTERSRDWPTEPFTTDIVGPWHVE
jgi:Holliday junction resolvase